MIAVAGADRILETDFVRGSEVPYGGPRGHKEWHHFAILAPGLDLLVNFSVCDDVRGAAPPDATSARLVVLARGEAWEGDVETFEPEHVRSAPGRLEYRLGRNRLSYRAGVFRIAVRMRDRPVSMDLELEATTEPVYVPSVPMLDGPPLHWTVVPRLEARGWVRIGGREHRLDGAPAYHDHNWGRFLWGHDVAWEWGFVLPDEPHVPWSATFVRLTNRARTRTLSHKMLVWKRRTMVRVFREGETVLRKSLGFFRQAAPFRVPRVMALVAPGSATGVPRETVARGVSGADEVECRCTTEAVGQVLIPSETTLGVTIFNEVSSRVAVSGRIGGERFAFGARGIQEFIRVV